MSYVVFITWNVCLNILIIVVPVPNCWLTNFINIFMRVRSLSFIVSIRSPFPTLTPLEYSRAISRSECSTVLLAHFRSYFHLQNFPSIIKTKQIFNFMILNYFWDSLIQINIGPDGTSDGWICLSDEPGGGGGVVAYAGALYPKRFCKKRFVLVSTP